MFVCVCVCVCVWDGEGGVREAALSVQKYVILEVKFFMALTTPPPPPPPPDSLLFNLNPIESDSTL